MYINFQDSDGNTRLHIAVFLCNIKACEILINNSVDMYIKDKWCWGLSEPHKNFCITKNFIRGQLSLHRICFCIGDENIINIINLFNSKKNFINNIFNELNNYGNTPFHLVLKYIIKNKVKLNDIHFKLIDKLKILTKIEIKNKEGLTIQNLLKFIYLIKYINLFIMDDNHYYNNKTYKNTTHK